MAQLMTVQSRCQCNAAEVHCYDIGRISAWSLGWSPFGPARMKAPDGGNAYLLRMVRHK